MSQPLLAEGEFALVREHLEAALPQSTLAWRPRGDHDLYALLADTAVLQRDAAALRRYAPLAEAAALRHEHTLFLALAQRAWGVAHRLAAEYGAAAARLNRALALFQKVGAVWQVGRTRYELGELAAAQGDQRAAHARYTQALADFAALRAVHDIARTQAALAALKL